MKRLLLLLLLASAPLSARAEAGGSALLPLANVGIAFPTGFEATGGVAFATVAETARGPSLSLRVDGFGARWGLSAGPGWVEEIDWGGFGVNLWFSRNWSGGPELSASLEGYVRLLVVEFRLGARAGPDETASAWQIEPLVGINFGI